jgi:hypothetical protein
LNPEAIGEFRGSEVGDTDDNGLYEFLDAWGHPITFFRNAPGFTGTDLQPDIVKKSGVSLGVTGQNHENWTTSIRGNWNGSEYSVDSTNTAIGIWGDYFDSESAFPFHRTWFLYPVIVSAGPDGIFDLWQDDAAVSGNQAFAPFDTANGIPEDLDGNGRLNNYDNIHNHRLSGY